MENKIKTVIQQYRQEKWANIISERNISGLSINPFILEGYTELTLTDVKAI
ncbi:hypothetical protein [Alkaliphilus hydrothermalis]|uniref:Uncharacterized protein n=1 Tax=Alkaliphilus hydrothermalis TaxID=1482730 RepID=A0ABS2NQ52_9FIRM|nr:hypothetical protein [Alkaliphilus hydrothermalis]MBM7615034.1 hypothetical protein [Alkaliphilus hydrothermalis]